MSRPGRSSAVPRRSDATSLTTSARSPSSPPRRPRRRCTWGWTAPVCRCARPRSKDAAASSPTVRPHAHGRRLHAGSRGDRRPSAGAKHCATCVAPHLVQLPLAPPDAAAAEAPELLAWMIGRGHLDVKVAVPCDAAGRPVNDTAIFHEKSVFIKDRAGDKIAWTGSLNETAAGWRPNWESINVYRSWGPEPERVGRRGAELRPALGDSLPACRRARRAGRRPPGSAALPAAGPACTHEGEDAAGCSGRLVGIGGVCPK